MKIKCEKCSKEFEWIEGECKEWCPECRPSFVLDVHNTVMGGGSRFGGKK